MKSWWKNDACFQSRARFFSTWQPSENIVNYISESTFSCFVFSFFFLQKNNQKMYEKSQPEKSSKNEPRGVPKWTQNSPELIGNITKMPKMAPQKSFLRDRFFDDFLIGKKTLFFGHARHWPFSYPGPGVLWGTIGGTTKLQNNTHCLNTPLSQRLGEFTQTTFYKN